MNMKTLLKQEFSEDTNIFGPDPLLHRKQGLKDTLQRDVVNYKEKLQDKKYMNYAIDKIAVELMHFLVK